MLEKWSQNPSTIETKSIKNRSKRGSEPSLERDSEKYQKLMQKGRSAGIDLGPISLQKSIKNRCKNSYKINVEKGMPKSRPGWILG